MKIENDTYPERSVPKADREYSLLFSNIRMTPLGRSGCVHGKGVAIFNEHTIIINAKVGLLYTWIFMTLFLTAATVIPFLPLGWETAKYFGCSFVLWAFICEFICVKRKTFEINTLLGRVYYNNLKAVYFLELENKKLLAFNAADETKNPSIRKELEERYLERFILIKTPKENWLQRLLHWEIS